MDRSSIYRYYTYVEMVEKIKELESRFNGTLIKVETSQQKYGVAFPDCEDVQCYTYILTITNFKNTEKTKPWVYLSGAVHGDERVGPNVVIETAQLLLENFQSNPWINYLLNNRVIVITPTTNPWGYHNNQREEKLHGKIIDPNRDFPYLIPQGECLQSTAAQTVYHLFAQHPFTTAITFHAGETSITFPWGAGNHVQGLHHSTRGYIEEKKSMNCPDYHSFKKLVGILKNTASSNNYLPQYRTGPITDIVYGVEGGMEDWGYAAGWENQHYAQEPERKSINFQCQSDGSDKYQEKDYDHVKTSILLIETSDNKQPPENEFGVRSENNRCVLNFIDTPFQDSIDESQKNDCKQKDGHISRNIRVCLSLIDMAAPYINLYKVEKSSQKIDLVWRIGGSSDVDTTAIYYDYFDSVEQLQKIAKGYFTKYQSDKFKINKQQIIKNGVEDVKQFIEQNFKNKIESDGGYGTWNFSEKDGILQVLTNFKVSLENKKGKKLGFIILAQTDSHFGDKVDEPEPNLRPQTYFVNQRIQKNFKFDFQKKAPENKVQYVSYFYSFSDLYVQ